MKIVAMGLLAAGLLAGTTAQAENSVDVSGDKPSNTCLYTPRIDHTQVLDSRTLLFHMKGGKIWKNTLKSDCSGLRFHGFVYTTHDMNLCANQQSIRVLESGSVCMLGAFEPYAKPKPEMKS